MSSIHYHTRSRIKDAHITRLNLCEFKTEWDYSAPLDPNSERLYWMYHTGGEHIDTKEEALIVDSPPRPQYSPVDTRGVGPNWAIDPQRFWPYTRWLATSTLITLAVNHNFVERWNDELVIPEFEYKKPLMPTIELSRNNNLLIFDVESHHDDMPDTSQYNRCRTRCYLQRRIGNAAWPNAPKYDNGGWQFWEADKTYRHEEATISPTVPVTVRMVAYNDGFAGASEPYIVQHVFAIPNPPIIQAITIESQGARIATNTKVDDIHPVDELVLERQRGSVCEPNGSWESLTPTYDYNTPGVKYLFDGTPERMPSTDQATWYRVRAWHDASTNASVSNIRPSAYTAKPAAPSISSAIWRQSGSKNFIKMNVDKVSNMPVDTYISVINTSDPALPEVVPPYKVDPSTLSDFDILDGGQPKSFDADAVYEVRVQNRLVNSTDPDAPKYGTLTVSDETRVTVRGSASAVAQATLSAPTIVSLTPNPSGRSVLLTWTTNQDIINVPYNDLGTLIEWTDADGGWQSTQAPSQYKYPDDGGNGGTISIDGLTEGINYKIRLRRYITIESEDGYGSAVFDEVTPWSTPSKPTLSAPSYILPGEELRYTWVFYDEGDTPQSAAQITINDIPYAIEGSTGSFIFKVPEDSEGEILTASVQVTCNGGWSEASEPVTTRVATKPTCTFELAGSSEVSEYYGGYTVTAAPLTVTVGGTGTSWSIRVTSVGGAKSPEPAGGRELAAGEVAISAIVHEAGTHELDSSKLIGGGNYNIECICIDDTTGMASDPVTGGFAVIWDRSATIPNGTVTIADNLAIIVPTQAEGAREDDICRIWRKTADGYQLACENAQWDAEHVDSVPPYASDALAYVIESVSADGDHAWREIPYSYSCTDATISLGGEIIALPWNLKPKSSYNKTFERRAHMDGSRTGFWQPGIDRDWTLSSQFQRENTELMNLVRKIGHYDGLCYVRGPRGVAFAANVDVDISMSYDDAFIDVDISCAEVADDGTYNVTPKGEEHQDSSESESTDEPTTEP